MNPMNKLIAVAIDKDTSSQHALKWTVNNLLVRGQTILLIHVKVKLGGSPFSSSSSLALSRSSRIEGIDENGGADVDLETKKLFLPLRVFCTRKDIRCQDVVLEDLDIAKALLEYVSRTGIEVLALGAASMGSLFRYKARDIPASVLKGVPDFCTVYIIAKGKISSTRSASRPAPVNHPMRQKILYQASTRSSASDASSLAPNNSRS